MDWKIKRFTELSHFELYSILKERTQVFVVEQSCPYLEVDGKDPHAFHVYAEKEGEIVSYLRVLPPGVSYPEASIGRVFVKEAYRRNGIGEELVRRGLEFLRNELNERSIKIQAQSYLERFYGSFGFKTVSDVYLEDNIPHIDMILSVPS